MKHLALACGVAALVSLPAQAQEELAKAQELLKETDLPIRTVAERAGFKHQEYMGAVFRARLNVTPRQFRQRFQGQR